MARKEARGRIAGSACRVRYRGCYSVPDDGVDEWLNSFRVNPVVICLIAEDSIEVVEVVVEEHFVKIGMHSCVVHYNLRCTACDHIEFTLIDLMLKQGSFSQEYFMRLIEARDIVW